MTRATRVRRAAAASAPARVVRVAGGQGFWGDWLEAPRRQLEGGPIDYLVLDYLAEVTMSILQKQRGRDPRAGFARDFLDVVKVAVPHIRDHGVRLVSNAGGVNPRGCAEQVLSVARDMGATGLRVGLVTGDDLMPRLDELLASGHPLAHMETGASLATIRSQVQAANVYLGVRPIVRLLDDGAQVVVTGRVSDAGMTLAPLAHEFGWAEDDWHRAAAGVVAGHILECGAQASGGNTSVDWRRIRRLESVGFPIVEAAEDGTFVVTKHPGTGGVVSVPGVTEQLVYEIGDPRRYLTPDVVADFTTLSLAPAGRDRVRVTGATGHGRPEMLKVSVAYAYGWKAVGTMLYAWPDAHAKAREADRIIRARLADLGLVFEKIHTEFVGVNAAHGAVAPTPDPDAPEVQLRIGVRAREKAPVERFTREMAPLVLTGPPGATGYAGGRAKVEEIVAYWPALIARDQVEPFIRTELLTA